MGLEDVKNALQGDRASYLQGYEDGREEGYDEGYDLGWADGEHEALGAHQAIADDEAFEAGRAEAFQEIRQGSGPEDPSPFQAVALLQPRCAE